MRAVHLVGLVWRLELVCTFGTQGVADSPASPMPLLLRELTSHDFTGRLREVRTDLRRRFSPRGLARLSFWRLVIGDGRTECRKGEQSLISYGLGTSLKGVWDLTERRQM